jgi:preprotein translocase subunit SecA
VERRVVLSVLDRKWREHLYEMDYLQEGIGLRAMAQRDPLVEYQREGFALWTTMNEAVREESVGLLFHVDVSVDQPVEEEAPVIEPVHVSQMLGAMSGAAPATADTSNGVQDTAVQDAPEAEPATVGAGSVFGGGRNVAVSGVGVGRPRTDRLHYTAPSETGGVDERDESGPASGSDLSADQMAGTPKNAPCPCGSGKKFKMCHGRR